MEKKVIFKYKNYTHIHRGETIVHEDSSILFFPEIKIGPFAVYLYDWTIELPTNMIGDGIYRIEYISGYFDKNSVKLTSIQIPKSIPGIVFAEINFPCADGIYYSDFYRIEKNKYFDKDNNIYAIGNLECNGICIEIATHNYIKLSKKGEILALYVKFGTHT